MKGCILDRRSFDRDDMDLDTLLGQLTEWDSYDSSTHDQAAERVSNANVVITNKVRLDRALIEAAPELKLVMLAATGTDNVDLEACRENGVTVCNARQYANPAVIQHVFTLMLSLMTNVMRYHHDVQAGRWSASPVFCLLDYPIRELEGKTLGIIGYGNLGQAVAAVGRAFGMHIAICERPGASASPGSDRLALEAFLESSDVISLHCPLTPQTENLFGPDQFRRMKSDALLINTARGAIVDSSALIDALYNGEIGGAGIDVLDQEPPPQDYPLIDPSIPNLIVTPHNAWGTRESRQRLVAQMVENLSAWCEGNAVRKVV